MPTHRIHRPTIGRTHHGHISTARLTLAVALVLVALFALIVVITLLAPPAGGQSSVLTFHATAQATIDKPPPAESLRIACAREVRADETPVGAKGWFSLLAPPRENAAWIAAFTLRKIGKPGNALSTTPRWTPIPTAKPVPGATLDWAWVWDRNGDGRVDYVAYLQNAQAVLPDPVPDTLPIPGRSAAGRFTLTAPLLYAMIDNTAMVFRHYADDDFDGKVDAVVVEEFDDLRPMFVRGWVVARATACDGVADEAWAFRHAITDTTRVIARGPDGTYRIPAVAAEGEPQSEPAAARFAHANAVLAAINALADRCGPVNGAIRRP